MQRVSHTRDTYKFSKVLWRRPPHMNLQHLGITRDSSLVSPVYLRSPIARTLVPNLSGYGVRPAVFLFYNARGREKKYFLELDGRV